MAIETVSVVVESFKLLILCTNEERREVACVVNEVELMELKNGLNLGAVDDEHSSMAGSKRF
jgi:hypothetical protein